MIGADAFIQTILDQPDADGPRLVFADWLEEHGECAHAELIRVQCELARLPDASPRKQELHVRQRLLLAGNDEQWGAVIRELGLSHRFCRGFMEVTVSGVRTLLEAADTLLERPWVLHVNLRDAAADLEDVADLATSLCFSRLHRLDLSRSYVGDDGVAKLAHSPYRCRPSHLLLNHIRLSTLGLRVILEHMDLSRLVELGLQGNTIGAGGARAIAMAPRLGRLRTLDLAYNHLGTVGGEYLAESLYLGHLHSLSVMGNSIGTRGKKKLRSRFGRRVILGGPEMPF